MEGGEVERGGGGGGGEEMGGGGGGDGGDGGGGGAGGLEEGGTLPDIFPTRYADDWPLIRLNPDRPLR